LIIEPIGLLMLKVGCGFDCAEDGTGTGGGFLAWRFLVGTGWDCWEVALSEGAAGRVSVWATGCAGTADCVTGENAWQGGRNSKTLVKHSDFRVVLTVLKFGARLHKHKAAGRISVQTVAGHIRMHVENKVFDLPVGHLLALEWAIAHDVEALEDSAFLLNIAWPDEITKV